MDVQDIVSFARQNVGGVIAIGVGVFVGLSVLVRSIGIFAWYVIILAIVLLGAALAGNILYFYAFLLGSVTAFTEIIGKFSDEPIKTFKAKEALLYHVFNGLIAAFALYVLILFGVPTGMPLDRMKIVLAAGIGSMLIMRSKLFNFKVGGEDVSFGPEQLIKVFFRFMEGAIDRVRAQARIEFVKKTMDNIDCEKVYEYSRTMLEAAQALDEKDRKDLEEAIKKIYEDHDEDKQLRSYRLGFALLNRMGEDFVAKLFTNPPPEWQIRAGAQTEAQGLLAKVPFFGQKKEEEVVDYFAYGPNMSTQELARRLGWSEAEAKNVWNIGKPKKAVLPGHCLVFAKPGGKEPDRYGLATPVPDASGAVEGVVYQLPESVMRFLDSYEKGYRRVPIKVVVDGNTIQGQTYMADALGEGLKPRKEYLDLILAGAEEHSLSVGYIQGLKSMEALAATTPDEQRVKSAVTEAGNNKSVN